MMNVNDFEKSVTQPEYEQEQVVRATELLERLFKRLHINIAIRLWNGHVLQLGGLLESKLKVDSLEVKPTQPAFTIICRSPYVVRQMVLGFDPLYFAEAYFIGDIDIEGDFFEAITLKDHLHAIYLPFKDKLCTFFSALKLEHNKLNTKDNISFKRLKVKQHSKTENQEAIGFHYDISNDFYALFLDENMLYSCAYFEHADNILEQAQVAKLDHICRKLLLKPGEHFLDIGCGWGALIIHAAKHYGVYAHGVTLSEQQFNYTRERIIKSGLEHLVTVELRDYRDMIGDADYDKIASIGMFEHVGLKNLALYFDTVYRLLKPAGLFLNHGITHDVEGWHKTISTQFINRYIFPDGQLDTISNIQRRMEHAKFEIADVESLRSHYAITLRHWVARLEYNHFQALQYVSEATYRIWRLYMASSALEFERGDIGIYQVLACKRDLGLAKLPLTRRHLYPV